MRAFLFALGGVAFAVLGAAGGAAGEGRTKLALLPIAVHSSEPDVEYLSDGLADMLSARLERSGRVAVIRVPDSGAALTPPAALQAARGVGADFVLFGSFTQFGEGASLDVQCARVAADPAAEDARREIFIQSGSVGEIIPRLDELAEKVARYLDGEAPHAAASASNGSEPGFQELRRRVEALERTVYLGDRREPPADADGLDVTGAPAPEAGEASVR